MFFVLIWEICEWFDGLFLLLGLIVIGEVFLVVCVFGVDFGYIGLVFIVINEVNV